MNTMNVPETAERNTSIVDPNIPRRGLPLGPATDPRVISMIERSRERIESMKANLREL